MESTNLPQVESHIIRAFPDLQISTKHNTVIPHGPQNRRYYLQRRVHSPTQKEAARPSNRFQRFMGTTY